MDYLKRALFLITLVAGWSYADGISSRLNIATQDGTVSAYPYKAKFSNGSVTDNGDGTVSITSSGGGGGASTLGINQNGISVTTPTAALNALAPPFKLSSVSGGTTAQWTLDPASVTLQGQNVINLTSSLQSGATFFVSSGTVSGTMQVTSTGTVTPFTMNVNGRPSGGEQNQIGGMTINGPDVSSTYSPALLVLADSTTNTTNGAGLLEIWENNPLHNSYLLWIHGLSQRNSDEPIRFDGPTFGIDEVSLSTDTSGTHGLGKWKVISEAYQTVDLQLASSRAWDNTTFENELYVHPLSKKDSPSGLYLQAQSLANDSAVLSSSDTSSVNFVGQNGSTVGLTGPLNPTGSYTFALPNHSGNTNGIMYQSDGGRGNNNNTRSLDISGGDLTYTTTLGVTVSTITSSSTTLKNGFTIPGPTNATLTEPNGLSGQIVISTAGAGVTAGHCAQFGSSITLVDAGAACGTGGGGTPASPVNSVQFNLNGAFGGSSNFQFNGTSVTVVSSITMNSGAGSPADNVTPGYLNVFNGADSYTGRVMFDVGSQGQRDQFFVPDRQPVNMAALGATIGNMDFGVTGTTNRLTDRSRSNYIDLQTASTMTFNTDNDIGGGDMVFQPQNAEVFRISKITAVTDKGPLGMNVTYGLAVGSMTASSATIGGQVFAGTMQGAGLATCGDGTHALNWSGGSFGCQTITASGGSSGRIFPIAISSGSATNSVAITTPTDNVVFDSNTFVGALQGTTTAYISLGSSVTKQGVISAASLGALTANQSITWTGSGDVSGTASGATSLTPTLTNAAVQSNIKTFTSSITVNLPIQLNGVITSTGPATFSSSFTVTSTSTFSGDINVSSAVFLNGSPGTNGQVLTSGGNRTIPTWQTPTAGGAITVSGDVAGLGTSIIGTTAAAVQANIKTFTSSVTFNGGVNLSSGIAVAIPADIIVGTATLTSTMSVVQSSCTPLANGNGAFMTLTLPSAASYPGTDMMIYKIDGSSCSIKITGAGSDVIEGTHTIQLDAQYQHASLHSLGGTAWVSGLGGIQYTPYNIQTVPMDNASYITSISSEVVQCPIYVPVPVAVTGFRVDRAAASGSNFFSVGLYDRNGKFLVQASSQAALSGANNYMMSKVYNLAPGWYKAAIALSNTTMQLTGSNSLADVTSWCSVGATPSITIDLSSSTLTTGGNRNIAAPHIGLVINGGQQAN